MTHFVTFLQREECSKSLCGNSSKRRKYVALLYSLLFSAFSSAEKLGIAISIRRHLS